MPYSSNLHLQHDFKVLTAKSTAPPNMSTLPRERQHMSLTQAYYIATSARSKLREEASRADLNLRLLIGHANFLDSFLIKLQDAKRKQEAWISHTMTEASNNEKPSHLQWADRVADSDSDSDSDSDFDSDSDSDFDDNFHMISMPRRITQTPIQISTVESDEDDKYYDKIDTDAELAPTRVPFQIQQPAELFYKEDSEDDIQPTPPSAAWLEFSEKEALLTTTYYIGKVPSEYLKKDPLPVMGTTVRHIESH